MTRRIFTSTVRYSFEVLCALSSKSSRVYAVIIICSTTVRCYRHGGNEFNLRAKLEDMVEIEKRRSGKDLSKSDAPMNLAEASRIMNATIQVMRILGWAWRWADWWVDYDSSWEPLLEPGQRESRMTKEQLKIVDSTRESRCEDARRCRLAAFGAALRNREYDTSEGCNRGALHRALKAVLHTRSLVGPLTEKEIDFFVDWLGRAYRSKSRLLGFGEDKIAVSENSQICLHLKDKSPKYELGKRLLPGTMELQEDGIYEVAIEEVDDFMMKGLLKDPPRQPPRKRDRSAEYKRNRDRKRNRKALVPPPESEEGGTEGVEVAGGSQSAAVAAVVPSAVRHRRRLPAADASESVTQNPTASRPRKRDRKREYERERKQRRDRRLKKELPEDSSGESDAEPAPRRRQQTVPKQPVAKDSHIKGFEGMVRLALPEDATALSPLRCFLREQTCAVSATEQQISLGVFQSSIVLNQVGIGCIHCIGKETKLRENRCILFPASMGRVYQSIADLVRYHFNECKNMPSAYKKKLKELQDTKPLGPNGIDTVHYWLLSMKKIGLVDTAQGMRFGRDPSEPASSVALVPRKFKKRTPRNRSGQLPSFQTRIREETVESPPARASDKTYATLETSAADALDLGVPTEGVAAFASKIREEAKDAGDEKLPPRRRSRSRELPAELAAPSDKITSRHGTSSESVAQTQESVTAAASPRRSLRRKERISSEPLSKFDLVKSRRRQTSRRMNVKNRLASKYYDSPAKPAAASRLSRAQERQEDRLSISELVSKRKEHLSPPQIERGPNDHIEAETKVAAEVPEEESKPPAVAAPAMAGRSKEEEEDTPQKRGRRRGKKKAVNELALTLH